VTSIGPRFALRTPWDTSGLSVALAAIRESSMGVVMLTALALAVVAPLVSPQTAAACLAYSHSADITDEHRVPNIVVIGRATRGGPPGTAPFTLTDVTVIRGAPPRPVRYGPADGWNCHPPNFKRGDRILILYWPRDVYGDELEDLGSAVWRIDDAGHVLAGEDWTFKIEGKQPTTVAEILSDFRIQTPDSAMRPPRAVPRVTQVGVALLVVAVAMGMLSLLRRARRLLDLGESG
jgi:hypothetical protein